MMTTPTVTIADHTTASNPRPHILYTIKTNLDGRLLVTQRRYSEFVALHEALKDPYNLPPKRLIVTTFIPSAWADDALIAERKAGLAEYLADLLATPKYKDKSALFDFLSPRTAEISQKFFLEDALPSTLTRTKAMNLAASTADGEVNASAVMISGAYYPDWSAGRRPPESIDYSKFDILFFCMYLRTISTAVV
ncbi:hypothetical protein NLJ89_g11741 [Agrocybe chaxingu]|uniref:PX domain-containing protein n=1 Tax=Agrocybe chaxingu TaxID=84603 RepID=A0A9W8MPQ9_9AGAR|nr:hypothetical protein NLJ89_g11741 [Agrocybe chaxingu]